MRISLRSALIVTLLSVSLTSAFAQSLLRITVTDTNNFRLGREASGLRLPESTRNPAYDALRRYLKPGKEAGDDDWQSIVSIARWVHQRWRHDPFGSAAPQTDALTLLQSFPPGAAFSCNEYSKVLRDMLRANGFIARSVTLQSRGIAYSGLGASHVAVEVYLSSLNKWILIDPQWGFVPGHNGRLLNIYEVYQLKTAGRYDEVVFDHFGSLTGEKLAASIKEYRSFLAEYFGYLSVDLLSDHERVNVIIALEGKSWPLTFQGLPRNAQIFAEAIGDIYFDVNRVSLTLNYRPESQPLNRQQIEFSSEQDYLAKMPQFAAVPDFMVTPHNNMPWFAFYEYRIDRGRWIKLMDEGFAWKLRKGQNRLEVRAVNSESRRGPVTYMQIDYK